MTHERSPRFAAAALLAAGLCAASDAHAIFHLAAIDEIMSSYDGDDTVQFVEIVMTASGQNIVSGSKLSVFDSTGQFSSVILAVDTNVDGGSGRHWIMATSAFEQIAGLTADFVFAPGLPTAGGMVCWGKPPDQTNPEHYVDCIAYGNYTGPSNALIGTPTPLTPEGHSLRRVGETHDNASDFECSEQADPENNAFETTVLPATAPCAAPAACGDATGDNSVTASDALFALATSVGAQTCEACRCDVDGNGTVTASDALRILAAAVGQDVILDCPACT